MFAQHRITPSGGEGVHPPGRATATILLVEDDTDVRIATRRLLERMGYHVLEAGSPLAAIDLTVVHRGEIDAVLSDMVMPGMNGRALAAEIRKLRPRIPVLFMSAYGDDETIRRHGLDDVGIAFLAKPFDAASLDAAVRGALQAK